MELFKRVVPSMEELKSSLITEDKKDKRVEEEFEDAKSKWESHDEWQFADRDAERMWFFLAGIELGKKQENERHRYFKKDAHVFVDKPFNPSKI
jgi:hypothetical protein